MWKTGSVERSPKSLINIKNTFYKKVLEESGAVFLFSNRGSKKIGNALFWAQELVQKIRKKTTFTKHPITQNFH